MEGGEGGSVITVRVWVLPCQIDSEALAAAVEVKGSCQGVLINLVRVQRTKGG